jgi:hypothetical protein
VRYVALRPHPPGRDASAGPSALAYVRAACIGAMAGSTLTVLGASPVLGASLGALAGALWRALRGGRKHGCAPFALVPWGLLVERDHEVTAVRWSGVRTLDVTYRAGPHGAVHARISVDSVAGTLVGYSAEAIDVGMLAGDLALVAEASSRPIAIDLQGTPGPRDGEPFVDRVLDAARTLLASGDVLTLGIEPSSYRDAQGCASGDGAQVAAALRSIGLRAAGGADVWALLAAVAGELRLRAFGGELARLTNAPHPCVAAFARTALARIGPYREEEAGDAAPDTSLGDSIAWFLAPEELEKLRAWEA